MTLQEEIDRTVGPAPQAPNDLRFLGWRLNQPEMEQYEANRRKYDMAVQAATHELVPQLYNPLRGGTLQDVAGIAGYNPKDIATPEQYQDRTVESPSLVPKTTLHYTAAGDMPMGDKLTPQTFRPQGPPDLRMGGEDFVGGGPREVFPGIQTRQVASPVQLQGPPNPARPEFYQREGDPLQTTTRELNLQAPSTLPQQMLGMSGLKREGSWPRSQGGGNSTAQFKYAQIAQAYGKDAADYWLAEGMLPGGLKAENLTARTDSSQSRGSLMDSQRTGQDLKNTDYNRMADDRHRNTESLIAQRQNSMAIANAMTESKRQLMEMDRQLKEHRLKGDSPEAQQSQQKIDLAREKLTLLEKYLAASKGETNDEVTSMLWEDIMGMAGVVGEVGKQSFWNRVNPFSAQPNVKRGGTPGTPGTSSLPGNASQSPSGGGQSTTGVAPSGSFSDAPPGKKPGQVLQKDGKPVADWNGKEWVPR